MRWRRLWAWRGGPWRLPLLVGAVSLAITGWLWQHEQQVTQRALRTDFDFSVRQTSSRIEQRLASYEQMLRGVQGLFSAADDVDRSDFVNYVDALLAGADFAGVQWLAYAPLRGAGGAAQAPVTFIAPATAVNLAFLGEDAYDDPLRRAAMLVSRDSGSIGITPRVGAPAERANAAQAGFLMLLPVYRRAWPVDSVAERRAALAGWVFASIRMADLMSSLYGERTPGIAVSVHDGVRPSGATLLYLSSAEAADTRATRLEAREYIGFAGHEWTVTVNALPLFEQRHRSDSARIIAIAGVGFSLMLALLTGQLLSGRASAHEAARAMTRELRASEDRYRRIVETADEGIWLTDANERTAFVNPKMAQMLGYAADELIGRPRNALIAAGEAADAGRIDAEAGDGAARRREIRLVRRDGGLLWASMATTPIVDTGGAPTGALAMVTDITGKVQAEATRAGLEAQLRESQKMEAVGTLAGGIAHDFNNILAVIIGNVALLRSTAVADPALQAGLEQVSMAAVRARTLVQQILAFSRRQPHRLQVQPLQPLVEESLRLLRPILPTLVGLQVTLPERAVNIAADATQLQQVMLNLCTNAWHALDGRAGSIDVGVDTLVLDDAAAARLGALQPGEHARLWVADNGQGMDEATRARVFEPFFTTKPVGQGTGLGLSVVHGIMAMHRGAITVDSSPGRGSRFELFFPLQEAVPAASASAPLVPQRGQGQRVMYVDDDHSMVMLAQAVLQREGYEVSCFDDPRAAMAALRARPDDFDVVVTDFNMPRMSGLDIARELSQLRPELPVIISSGHVGEDMLAAALQAGVRSVLQKEYTIEQLARLVHRVLAQPTP